jgi:hypothetical protein
MTRSRDPIRKIERADGTVRWRFIIDIGTRADGKRDQRCYTFDRKTDAVRKRADILSELGRGKAPCMSSACARLPTWGRKRTGGTNESARLATSERAASSRARCRLLTRKRDVGFRRGVSRSLAGRRTC